MARLSLPVPPPRATTDGDTLVGLESIGVHRDGQDFSRGECQHLDRLLAGIHSGLGGDGSAGVLTPAPESPAMAVAETVKAKAKIDWDV